MPEAVAGDPRTKTSQKDMWNTVGASIAKGFETRMSSPDSALQEFVRTQRELSTQLSVLTRKLDGEAATAGTQMSPPTAERAAKRAGAARHAQSAGPRRSRPDNMGSPQDEMRQAVLQGSLVDRTRSDIRSSIYKSAARRMSEYTTSRRTFVNGLSLGTNGAILPAGITMDEHGRPKRGNTFLTQAEYRAAVSSALPSSVRMASNGRYQDAHGRFLSSSQAAGLITDAASVRRASFAASAGRGLEAWSQGAPIGRSLMSALPSGALKAAGVVGVGWTAANAAWSGVQGQYAKNQEYRGVYGYGQTDALKDRASSWINRNITGRFSMLGSDGYDALWKGAMSEGLRGSDRDRYIRTGTGIAATGASVDYANKLMQAAIDAGHGLAGLVPVLKGVSAAAKEAGINGNKARDAFLRNYQSTSQTLMGGVDGMAAKQMAAALTRASIGMGRGYESVDFGGLYSSTKMHYATAATSGVTSSQLWSSMAADPAGGMQASEDFVRRRLGALGSTSGVRMEQAVKNFVAQNGGWHGEYDIQPLSDYLEKAGFNREIVYGMLQQMNITTTPGQALGTAGALFVSGTTPGDIAKATSDANRESLSAAVPVERSSSGRIISPMFSTSLGRAYAQSPGAHATGLVAKTLKMSGVNGKNVQVVVTKDGKKVIMSMEDALKYAPDQMAAGTYTYYSGVDEQYMRKSGYEVAGLNAPLDVKITSDKAALPDGVESRGLPTTSTHIGLTKEIGGGSSPSGGEGDGQVVAVRFTGYAERFFEQVPTTDPMAISP